jgi:hypothetical protein
MWGGARFGLALAAVALMVVIVIVLWAITHIQMRCDPPKLHRRRKSVHRSELTLASQPNALTAPGAPVHPSPTRTASPYAIRRPSTEMVSSGGERVSLAAQPHGAGSVSRESGGAREAEERSPYARRHVDLELDAPPTPPRADATPLGAPTKAWRAGPGPESLSALPVLAEGTSAVCMLGPKGVPTLVRGGPARPWDVLPVNLRLGTSKRPMFLPPAADDDKRVQQDAVTANTTGRPTKQWRPAPSGACDAAVQPLHTPLLKAGCRRLFFGVGINYVSQPKNTLASCWNDVETMHRELEARCGPFAHTWLLTDRPLTTHAKLRPKLRNRAAGRSPTVHAFWTTWDEILREARTTPEEVEIVFVYSGHGSFRLTTDPFELYGQSDCLILLDQFVWDYEVVARMVKALANSMRMFMLLDSCNSGSAANLPWTFNPLSETVNQTSQHTALTQNVVMISGCRDEQTSAAGQGPNDLSECTRVLLETLHKSPAPGSIPIPELVVGMRRLLVAAQDTQIPQLSMSRPALLGSLL